MSIRLKELLEGISAQVGGKRILAIECEREDGFVTAEKLLVHIDYGSRIEIEGATCTT
jgi:hypothetical protein